MSNRDFHPFQVWCCNRELYEQGDNMGMSRAFHNSKDALDYYDEHCALAGGRVAFEYRLYASPDLWKVHITNL